MTAQQPTLFLICGLPGSGKTTLARELEVGHRALRLTPDEWIARILPEEFTQEELDRLRSPVEEIQWELARRSLELGTNVILDWGLWSREERDAFRRQGEEVGARVEVRLADAPLEDLLDRLRTRKAGLRRGEFAVTEEQLRLWSTWFEAPDAEELA